MSLHPKKLFPEVENIELLNHQSVTKKDLLNFGNLLLQEFKTLSNTNEQPAQWLKSSEVRKLLKISPGTLQTHPYNEIAIKGKRPLIQNNQVNSIFVSKLKLVGYISKSDIEEKGIRISTFRK